MATFLDISVLEGFSGIFTFLLVYVVAFGILEVATPFGKEKKGLAALLALLLSLFVLFSGPARYVVEFMVPWLTIMAIVIFFVLFVFMAFGVDASSIKSMAMISGNKNTIIALSVILLLFALGGAFGQDVANPAPIVVEEYPETGLSPAYNEEGEYLGVQPVPTGPNNSFAAKVIATVTHPKILGMIFVLLLGTFTIAFLTRT